MRTACARGRAHGRICICPPLYLPPAAVGGRLCHRCRRQTRCSPAPRACGRAFFRSHSNRSTGG